MKIFYSADTYVRHHGSGSLLWNRRTSACAILKDAKPFLDAVSYDPQDEEAIVRKVAAAFETAPAEVAADVREFLRMLVDETFCENGSPAVRRPCPSAKADGWLRFSRTATATDFPTIPSKERTPFATPPNSSF